jgi:hypothetical protein
VTDDFDSTLTALLAEPDDADTKAFAEDVIRRIEHRSATRTLVLAGFGVAGLAIFVWQLVAQLDALGATLHRLLGGGPSSIELVVTAGLVAMLAGMLAGGRRSAADSL